MESGLFTLVEEVIRLTIIMTSKKCSTSKSKRYYHKENKVLKIKEELCVHDFNIATDKGGVTFIALYSSSSRL